MTNNNIIAKMRDKEFRAKLRSNPSEYAKDLGFEAHVEYKVVTNSKDTVYFIFPKVDVNSENLNLEDIQAAGSASSAGTVSTAGTAGSICTTISTAGSLTTAGSSGTVS